MNTWYLYFIAFFSALGGLLFGYDTGIISGAILFIRQDFALDFAQMEMVVSAVLLGAVLGSLSAGFLVDRVGRRPLLIATGFVFTIATLASALAPTPLTLILTRIFVGMALGLSSLTIPMYIAEISPASIRGRLVSLNQLAITVGILLSYGVGYALSHSENWRLMIALGALPSALFGIGMFFLPESPRWLILHGQLPEAQRILTAIHGKERAWSEIAEIQQGISLLKTRPLNLWGQNLRPLLLLGVALAIFQQTTGINTIIYYAPIIFQSAGFQTATSAVLATGIIGIVNVLATIGVLCYVDSSGRRRLLLIGLSGMILSLGVLGYAFFQPHLSELLGWITLGSLMVYVASFAISLGPMFWLLIAEIYPTEVRGSAMSVATIANWISNFIVAFTFLTLVNAIGSAFTFWLYGLIAAGAWIFCYYLVPETKNQTLEELNS